MSAILTIVAAGSLEAQGNMGNTQRALRPGQSKGPTFMVPVFRSDDKALGVQVADAVRDRLMNDNLVTSMWVVSKKDLESNLQQSGYTGGEALTEGDLKQLAIFIHAEEYVDGAVTRDGGNITLTATLNLPRGEGMVQPLGSFTGAKPGDVAGKLSAELEKARKQIKGATDCMQSNRMRQYPEAKANAQKAISAYPNAIFARICLLEGAIAQKASDDEKIKIAEEILAISPENDRALKVLVDAYAAKVTTDKANYEAKYIAALEKTLKADPTNTTLQAQVISALAAANQMEKAKTIVDEAVKQSPGDPDLIRLQYRVYRAMNNWKGAIAVGEEMVKHDTAAADTLFFQQLVASYLSDSQPVKAQEAAARGAAKFPTNITLWLSVAQLARQNGQLPQALEAISKVMSLDPKNSTAALQKAQIFSEQDQLDSMTVALRSAVAAGAPKETASGMVLNKVNPWLQRWSKDTAKTVAEGEQLLGVVMFADSLNSSPATALFSGLVQLQLGQTVLGEAARTRNCDMAKKGKDYVAKSQEVLPKAGRQFPDQTAGAMNGVMQLLPYGEQVERAVCRPGGPARPPR